MTVTPDPVEYGAAELAVLDAVIACVEEHGWDKVTMDDICTAAGVSRATLYRMFPGGRDVLFEAVRVRGLNDFFTVVRAHVEGADSLEEVLVRCLTVAAGELAGDQHLAAMLATAPGETLGDLTVGGMSRIIRVAVATMTPYLDPYIAHDDAEELVEILCRLVVSTYLAPSSTIDFSDEESVRHLVRTYVHAHVNAG